MAPDTSKDGGSFTVKCNSQRQPLNPEDEGTRTTHTATLCNILEDWQSQQHCLQNMKLYTKFVIFFVNSKAGFNECQAQGAVIEQKSGWPLEEDKP